MTMVGEGDSPADMIHINAADEQFMKAQKATLTEKNNIATRHRLSNWGVVIIQTPKGVFNKPAMLSWELRGNLLRKKHEANGLQQVSANGERYGKSIAMTVGGSTAVSSPTAACRSEECLELLWGNSITTSEEETTCHGPCPSPRHRLCPGLHANPGAIPSTCALPHPARMRPPVPRFLDPVPVSTYRETPNRIGAVLATYRQTVLPRRDHDHDLGHGFDTNSLGNRPNPGCPCPCLS